MGRRENIGIDWAEFQGVVKFQKKRGIIQGDFYLYISPFPLVTYLINEWSIHYSGGKPINEFIDSIPEEFKIDMQKRFLSRIPYIGETLEGGIFVRRSLSERGPFSNVIALNDTFLSEFFLKLAEVEPKDALIRLKAILGHLNKEQLLQLKNGRFRVVGALEYIAQWKEYFIDAANLLLALARSREYEL